MSGYHDLFLDFFKREDVLNGFLFEIITKSQGPQLTPLTLYAAYTLYTGSKLPILVACSMLNVVLAVTMNIWWTPWG